MAHKRRYRRTWPARRKILDICLNNPGISHADIGLANNCSSSQISKWFKTLSCVASWAGAPDANKPQRIEKRARFFEAEVELYDRFLHRRKVKGLYVDGLWLKQNMKKILRTFRPWGYSTFKASQGWLWRFCRRWKISSQAKTDGKTESAECRKIKIEEVINAYKDIQSQGFNDPVFGRFSPEQHWSVDQIPFSFSHPRRRSLNSIGTHCRISGVVRANWARRQASIQLTIRAVGEQLVPPVIILKGTGKEIKPEELEHILGLQRVLVYYQPKAWCDR